MITRLLNTGNRNLHIGDIVREVRSHPYIKKDRMPNDSLWSFMSQILYFEILEVGRGEYTCRYITDMRYEDNDYCSEEYSPPKSKDSPFY